MQLTKGKILRFKGRCALAEAMTVEAELQGRCKRVANEIEITHTTHLRVALPAQVEVDRLGLTPFVLGSNDHEEANRVLNRG